MSQRPLEAAFPAAEGVVGRGVGAVEADAQGVDARLLARWNASRVASGVAEGVSATCSPHAAAWPISSNRSARFSGSPPVMHDRRPPRERGRLVEQGLRLLGRQLLGVGLLLGRRPAVLAHQVAGLGDLVVEHQRIAAEIVGRVEWAGCMRLAVED